MNQTRLIRYVYGSLVDYERIDADGILDIHKYLRKRTK